MTQDLKSEEIDLSQQTIVFVDDEAEIRKALQRTLKSESYQCLFAESGRQALRILNERPVSVLVSDLRMPQMDGMALLQHAREKHPDTVRLVLSGRFDGNTVIDAVNQGHIHRYIPKPWDNDELKIILRNALQVYHLHRERRRLISRLEEQNKHLEQKVEQRTQQLLKVRSQAEIGKYAAQIVHNLKNPLHALGASLELFGLMFNEGQGDVNELRRVIGLAHKSLHDLKQIVSGILNHAREEGQYYLEKVDVNKVIRQELSFFDLDPFFRRKIKKQVQLDETIPAILGSSTQIKQIIDNLVRNAVDAMARSAVMQLNVKTESDESAVYIEVSDTGEGIKAENLSRIFSGEFTTKPMGVGTGIGLASAKRIVSTYGGDIKVDSVEGSGTTFRLSFPVRQDRHLADTLAGISI